MKKQLEKRPCKNINELKDAIFQTITTATTENLVYSMPRCCAAVVAAHGGSTKY